MNIDVFVYTRVHAYVCILVCLSEYICVYFCVLIYAYVHMEVPVV